MIAVSFVFCCDAKHSDIIQGPVMFVATCFRKGSPFRSLGDLGSYSRKQNSKNWEFWLRKRREKKNKFLSSKMLSSRSRDPKNVTKKKARVNFLILKTLNMDS